MSPAGFGCSTTVFSHSQTVVVCSSCSAVLCTPTGGKARLTEGDLTPPVPPFPPAVSLIYCTPGPYTWMGFWSICEFELGTECSGHPCSQSIHRMALFAAGCSFRKKGDTPLVV